MSYRFITSERDGGVVTIAINRPDRLNALTPNVMAELTEAIDKAIDGGARALVLTGEGRSFCAGADLRADGAGYTGLPEDLGELLDDHYNPFVAKLADLPVPLVTAVNGPAVGAGMSLALAGDIVVAARSAFLLLAFVNIGLVPDLGASWLVTRAVGRARALELALLGEEITAEDARAMGLITRVTDDGKALEEAQAIAHRLTKGPAKAIGLIRKQIGDALDTGFAEMLERERANQSIAGRTEDFKEALDAFAHKRRPIFKGR
ncbi:enoyl-CoA hydratase-related protein [Croceicoccus sp. Ery5]|jgi:2-(1,2-epoxy-1,2-dihydrophenyl)acetyl-CoA isomerase|uniref:enoyl-CoA hydratase-related protein n=1 Tax=Croceicoccus sp. Ery5 TaxID=1703340 RepID=UPI001E652493|nr:enoyl-CoA hydratase-related protein [Croceicoccus sp. Ery5]